MHNISIEAFLIDFVKTAIGWSVLPYLAFWLLHRYRRDLDKDSRAKMAVYRSLYLGVFVWFVIPLITATWLVEFWGLTGRKAIFTNFIIIVVFGVPIQARKRV